MHCYEGSLDVVTIVFTFRMKILEYNNYSNEYFHHSNNDILP
jgi:hypothetical protein